MCDEPADGRVDRPTRRRDVVRNRWRAVDFVGRFRLLNLGLPPRPTGVGANQDNQGHNSNRAENAEDHYWYEPCPKALANLEDRGGPSLHGWPSEISSSSKER